MKVINYSRNDYANFSYDNAMALQSVGVDCKSYVTNKHSYNYTHTSEQISNENIMAQMNEADFVQIFHTDIEALKIFIHSNSKAKLIVYHTGSVYRRSPKLMNSLFNPHAYKVVCALPEFMGLCKMNEQYLVGAVDTDRIQPHPSHPQIPYDIRHYPSNFEKKGTIDILRMITEIKTADNFIFTHSVELKDMSCQYERVRECDIYVELFKPVLEGKPYGSFGIQALEAAAMGKVVITQNLNPDLYFNEYGFNRLFFADNEEGFKEIINTLIMLSPKDIQELQDETRQWVVDNHSYKATGSKIVEKILQ